MKDFESMMKNLEQSRDELKVQAHLFNAEMKDEWHQLEDKWEHFARDVRPAMKAAKEASQNISEANKLMMEEIREGFKNIMDKL